jgi:NADP-dependent 3-hydroxy acid dehydrogenase YdfG
VTGDTAGRRLAVVTGASSGIGRAIALELAALGVDLWLVARRAETLEATGVEARRRGARAWSCALDIRSDADLKQFCDRVRKDCDGLDVLVHSAGSHFLGAVADAPVAELDEQYQVNLRGPYVLTQLLLPLLRARRGQIVFVNSSAGLEARAHVGAYAATKHALKALADALRQEVNVDGVRVVSVYPGRTATPLQEVIHAQDGTPYRPERLLQAGDVAAAVMHAIGMARTAEVTDIRVRPMQPPGAK